MSDRGQEFAHLARGRGVERVLLALHRPAGAHVRPRANALRHKPPHPHCLSGRQQVIRPLGPQAVGQREIAIEMTWVKTARDRGQLMDDHVRPRPVHGLRDLIRIQRIGNHRRRPKLIEQSPVGLLAGHPNDLVPRGHQPRHQLLANRSRRASHKHLHGHFLSTKRTTTRKTR